MIRQRGSFPSQAVDHGRLFAQIEADEDVERRLAQGYIVTFERTECRCEGGLRRGRRERAKRLHSHRRRWILEHRQRERDHIVRARDAEPPDGRGPHVGALVGEEHAEAPHRARTGRPSQQRHPDGAGDHRIRIRLERPQPLFKLEDARPVRDRLDRCESDDRRLVPERTGQDRPIERPRLGQPTDRERPDHRVHVLRAILELSSDARVVARRE